MHAYRTGTTGTRQAGRKEEYTCYPPGAFDDWLSYDASLSFTPSMIMKHGFPDKMRSMRNTKLLSCHMNCCKVGQQICSQMSAPL